MRKTNNTYLIIVTLALAVFLGSCAAMMGPDLSKINIGMSKEEVRHALKVKPQNIVAADRDEMGRLVEIHEYLKLVDSATTDRYWLYYTDGRLERWQRMPRQRNGRGPRDGHR